MIDIRDLGAKGAGADDTTAFLKALALPGPTYVPEGQWLVTAPLVCQHKGTTLCGPGEIQVGHTGAGFDFAGQPNCVLKGVTLRALMGVGVGVQVPFTSHYYAVRGCRILGYAGDNARGLSVRSSFYGEISHNFIDAGGPDPGSEGRVGVDLANEVKGLHMSGNAVKGYSTGVRLGAEVWGGSTEGVTLVANTIEDNGHSGPVAAIHVDGASECVIVGNRLEYGGLHVLVDSADVGPDVVGARHNQFVANTCHGPGSGFEIRRAQGTTIVGGQAGHVHLTSEAQYTSISGAPGCISGLADSGFGTRVMVDPANGTGYLKNGFDKTMSIVPGGVLTALDIGPKPLEIRNEGWPHTTVGKDRGVPTLATGNVRLSGDAGPGPAGTVTLTARQNVGPDGTGYLEAYIGDVLVRIPVTRVD